MSNPQWEKSKEKRHTRNVYNAELGYLGNCTQKVRREKTILQDSDFE